MKYRDFIEKLGLIVDESGLLLRVAGDVVCVEGRCFSYSSINRIQRLLQRYGECEWWIVASEMVENGVMYKIRILNDIE